MQRLGLEFITAHGLDPVEFVHLAADFEVDWIGLALSPVVLLPENRQSWTLRDDATLFRATRDALAARGVTIGLAEGFLIHPQMDIAQAAHDLDLVAELGAMRVNTVSLESDRTRSHDQFALFAEMATERSMAATIEFLPGVAVGTLAAAVDHAVAAGVESAGIMIDAMHLFRSGGSVEQVAALDPAIIGHAQLCDVPAQGGAMAYVDEAKFERQVPGEGELPLRELIAALPATVPLGLEVPQRSRCEAGEDDRYRIAQLLERTRNFTTGLL